ncbi:hypothetical protein CMK10_07910 [Candidatus Poribacteria bacterium]|nr:hypothetical protein [Candidatus Poribacteria bacterium]
MRFQGKSVIVTGGASGIGAATVKLFIDEGARVIIADIDPKGQSLAEKTQPTRPKGNLRSN